MRFFFLALALASPLSAEDAADCSAKNRALYEVGRLSEAEAGFRECVKNFPKDADARVSLAGVLLAEENYSGAKTEFEAALKLLAAGSQLAAYCNSRLGDIALKSRDYGEAAARYKKALAISPSDANALVGLGKCGESAKDWTQAAEYYRRGLEAEPLNAAAKEGLKKAEPYVMSDEEILSELKERKALSPATTELAEEDREIFVQFRDAEEMGAVDYLKQKLSLLPEKYVLEKREPRLRLFLTLQGFSVYRLNLTKDALSHYEKKGLPAKTVFAMKCMDGKPLMEDSGLLSYCGMQAYYHSLVGEKNYLLPTDPLPPEAMAALPEEEQLAAKLLRTGYIEITDAEFRWLCDVTDCTKDTFENDLDMRFILGRKNVTRYFVDITGFKKDKGLLGVYIGQYRNGDTSVPVGRSSAFFGVGGLERKKLCTKDGKVWTGE